MREQKSTISPVSLSERILSLDVLRGFAVLGILIMNIQSYSMIEAAYINPTAYGDLTGINKWVWIFSHIFGDQKFLSIFSILFGAGIVLFSSRAESRGRSATWLHYRRTFWLFILGMMHAYLLWHGDILVTYAICAVLAFLFRKRSPKLLLILGILVISVSSLFYLMGGLTISSWPQESINGTMMSWRPGQAVIDHEIAAYQNGWLAQMAHRIPSSIKFQTMVFLMYTGWRAGGLMLVGMALYKWGVLSAERSSKFYSRLAILALGLGLPIVIFGVIRNFAEGWTLAYSMFLGWQFNYWGSLFVAASYIGLVMLLCQSNVWEGLKRRLSAVGRMAFTNYLMQTIVCTTIFYGHGFGLFGHVERVWQLVIVFCVWILQLYMSPIWIRHFKYGPVEWLWRTLTYWKFQPMKYRHSN